MAWGVLCQLSCLLTEAQILKRLSCQQMLEERLQRVQEVQSALEEAKAASMTLEPVAKRKLRKEIEKASFGRRNLASWFLDLKVACVN